MRTFISIPLPVGIRNVLVDLQKELSGFAKVKWVTKKNIHLTLKFLGEVEERRLEEIKRILRTIKFSRFKAELSSIGAFPNLNHINTLWISIEPKNEIIKLQQQVDQLLLSYFPQQQKFTSHITLGRVKFIKKREQMIQKINKLQIPKQKFEITKFELTKSTLTKDGPIYEVIEEFNSC